MFLSLHCAKTLARGARSLSVLQLFYIFLGIWVYSRPSGKNGSSKLERVAGLRGAGKFCELFLFFANLFLFFDRELTGLICAYRYSGPSSLRQCKTAKGHPPR